MTAQEFVTSVQAGGTVNIDSDVDFTDYEFTTYISVPPGTTINGNGFALKNIYAIGVPIFRGNVFTINYLEIVNLNLPNSALFMHNSNVISTNINTCKISGYVYRLVDRATSSLLYGVRFYRCSLNVSRYNNIFGYFVESYITVSGNLVKTATISSPIRIGNEITSCYVVGTLDADGDIYIATIFSDSVFNVDISENHIISIATAGAGALISVFNSDKNNGEYSFATPSVTIAVTDSQMKDSTYLFGIGFNIYTG